VWIETTSWQRNQPSMKSHVPVGVWVETLVLCWQLSHFASRPTWAWKGVETLKLNEYEKDLWSRPCGRVD
jgi:hypothetical protein